MKVVRDYLTSEEISFIIDSMLKNDNAVAREVLKVGMVAQFLCEDLGEFESWNNIYDKVVADSKLNFSEIVNNYDIIDKLYAQETSTEKILKDFVNSINSKLDKSLKDFDLNSLTHIGKKIILGEIYMKILSIESSCDETAAAIISGNPFDENFYFCEILARK